MTRPALHRGVGAAALVAGLTSMLSLTAPATGAASPAKSWTRGYCKSDSGVTVVVDFTALDRPNDGVVVRCVTTPVKTGIDALEKAGLPPTGTTQYGLQFVCRIADRPGPGEPLPVDGDPGYTESCQQTPPQSAYWGYFTAPNGGPWAFSSVGPSSHHPIPGGFEGWSFQLNQTQPQPPAAAPSHPEPSPSPTPPATSPSPTAAPTSPTPASPSGPAGHSSGQAAPPSNVAATPSTTAPTRIHGSGSGVPGRRSQPVLRRAADRHTVRADGSPTTTAAARDIPTTKPSPTSAGSSAATWGSLGIAAVLAAAAGVTAWRRSRRT